MISNMGAQLKRQLEGLEELSLFTNKETSSFQRTVYPSLLEQAQQALAKVSMATHWLREDLSLLGSGQNQSALQATLALLQEDRLRVCEHFLHRSEASLIAVVLFLCSCRKC